MPNAFAVKDTEKCHKQYFQVERKGSTLKIMFIKSDFYRDRQIVPTIYLGPAGNARF